MNDIFANNMVKYNVDQEIMITYKNLRKVWSQLFVDLLLFIYILSNLKKIGLSVFRLDLFDKWLTVPLKYLVNSNSHLNFEFDGKIKFNAVT